MVGDFQNMGGMDAVGRTKSSNALEHRGAVDSVVEEEVQEAGVHRDSVMLGSIAEVD
jgi:hypothetical protein